MAGVDSLLSSFPAPPSFIPPSPLPYDRDENEDDGDYFSAQLGMGPPRMPLPAVPGGLNELDALMSIVQSPAPSRRESRASRSSWRFSRLSDTSTYIKSEHMAPLQPRSSISLPDETTSSPSTPTQAAPYPKRSASPDINELLATTPRPLVRRLNSLTFTASTASSSSSLINPEDDFDSNSSEDEHSDSSIDIITPLPNLMVKAGLLSPRSKILAPVEDLSQSTVPKDERDTHRRRNRHRNGRLLSEGVGLTTGLGWSDSEDEDAPSALTHRLSTIDLSRRPSMLSLGTRSRSRSEYSPSARHSRSTSSFAKDRSPLSRTSSTASAATFGAMSITTNSRGHNPSASENARTSRKRTASEGPSIRSGSSMTILGAYISESDHVPEPMPALPELAPSRAGYGSGLRKATSAYPLPRSMSIDSQMTSASSIQSSYAVPPMSPASLMGEKPLPQLPVLEDPPPRSDSRGAIRSRGKSNAPPSSYGRATTPTRKRTTSTSSATSTSSVGSAINARVSPTPSMSRPPMPTQTSAPLRRANVASVPRSSANGSSMPQIRKRPSQLSLPQREHANLAVLAVNVSPLASPTPSTSPTPLSAVSSLATPASAAQPVSPSAVTDLASKMLPPRSPSAPRALRLGTPGTSRIVAPRASVSGANPVAAAAAAAPSAIPSALPTPRGRTTSVSRMQTPRTGAGMAYRISGAPATRA